MSESIYPPLDDSSAVRALRECLHSDVLSPAALLRIRRATEEEWRRTVRPARRPRTVALAASLLALAVAGAAVLLGSGARGERGALLAHLARSAPGDVIEIRRWRADRPLRVGAEMRAGQTFQTRGVSLVALQGGGNLRLQPGSVFEIESGNAVWLEHGEMYVDIPPGTHLDAAFVARTADGEFRHVGTQFALAVFDGTTRLRVREGAVQWRTDAGESTVAAGSEVIIERDRPAVRRPIGIRGAEWAWIETVTPDVDIENRPLSEFLQWVARETGRKLVFADEEARRQIGIIRMHGNVRGLTTMQALSAVMAATTLRFDLVDGAIRVSFAGAAPPTSK